MAIINYQLNDAPQSNLLVSDYWTTSSSWTSTTLCDFAVDLTNTIPNFPSSSDDHMTTICTIGNFTVRAYTRGSGSNWAINVWGYIGDISSSSNRIFNLGTSGTASANLKIGFCFGLDPDTEYGYFTLCLYGVQYSTRYIAVRADITNSKRALLGQEYLNNPYVQYHWSSVASISGKNGILSLAQIEEEYINDGESVSGASADYFANLSTKNRVDVLIDDALPAPEIEGTTVTVKYTIPSLSTGSYEYCKLVAKKNSMPESHEDGDKIIDINPNLTSIVVRGLDQLSHYYFVIFIEDNQGNTASSKPKDCMTGEYLGIVNITIPTSGQAQLNESSQWTETNQQLPFGSASACRTYGETSANYFEWGDTDLVTLPSVNTYTLLWERNDIKCYYCRTSYYDQGGLGIAIVNENNETVLGVLDASKGDYAQNAMAIHHNFIGSSGYNKNQKCSVSKINLAYGVDHQEQLGYVQFCTNIHWGYDGTGDAKWVEGCSMLYHYGSVNGKKLYDALVRASQ